jgi:hypothetical protein
MRIYAEVKYCLYAAHVVVCESKLLELKARHFTRPILPTR